MPCNCDHMEPDEYEVESRQVAKHIVYVTGTVGLPCPNWIVETAGSLYGNASQIHKLTEQLCKLCKQYDKIILSNCATSRKARALADWWEDHQEADRKKSEKKDRLAWRDIWKGKYPTEGVEIEIKSTTGDVISNMKYHDDRWVSVDGLMEFTGEVAAWRYV